MVRDGGFGWRLKFWRARRKSLNSPLLIAILAFGGAIWLSNKAYATDAEKQAGHRLAMVLFFLVGPAFLYFGGF